MILQKIEKVTGGKWNQILLQKDDELDRIAQMITDLIPKGVNIYININNNYKDSAPLTINRIKNLL